MLINVDDPVRNLILNACFYSVLLLTLVAITPWGALGAVRMSRLLRWLPLPLLGLAIAYETAMPFRFDIRIDLLVLLPAYALVLMSSVVRWFVWRQRERAAW
jgi:hypothetical protein